VLERVCACVLSRAGLLVRLRSCVCVGVPECVLACVSVGVIVWFCVWVWVSVHVLVCVPVFAR
jgi:G:T-mismatch repair DNA endonuclease (very short patch repair protein)